MPFFPTRPHSNAHARAPHARRQVKYNHVHVMSARARRAGPAGALRTRLSLPMPSAYTLLRKMSETSVKIIKNEEGCRDDSVPKTVETRRHCESMQQSSATPSLHLGFWGLRKIVACSQSTSQCLLVSTVFGTLSSLHSSFLMIFTLVYI